MAIPTRGLVLGTTVAAVAAVTVVGAGLHLPEGQAFFRDSPKEVVDEVWQLIDRTYVDGTFNQVDWKDVRRQYLIDRSYNSKEDAYTAVREMLKLLGDPYTRFMNPQEYKNMQVDTSGELFGVGIQLSADEKTKKLTVIAPIEDSPAFSAGIQPKDIITYIDGKSTDGMDVNAAVNLIRGPAGSKVKLTIQRGDKSQDYQLTRARIEIHPVKFSVQKLPPSETLGYVRLTQFSAKAPDEMRNAILKLEDQKVSGYILDLRSNPGGLLDASVQIARNWINEGKIVSTVERRGESSAQQANRTALTEKPLVVLVDGGSASASEILSGALQDNKRATIIGTKTFGKGLVQSVRELRDGSGLAVTIAKYLTPAGRDINKHGIDPDIPVQLSDDKRKELVADRDKIGTLADPQYAKAVEILGMRLKGLTVPSAIPNTSPSPSSNASPNPTASASPTVIPGTTPNPMPSGSPKP